MVRSRRLELPRPFGHSDLNAARLPVPPRPHVMIIAGAGPAAATGKAARLAKPPEGRNAAMKTAELVHFGTKVNALFTFGETRRYGLRHVPRRRSPPRRIAAVRTSLPGGRDGKRAGHDQDRDWRRAPPRRRNAKRLRTEGKVDAGAAGRNVARCQADRIREAAVARRAADPE